MNFTPSKTQLQQALAIAEQIERLESKLAALLGNDGGSESKTKPVKGKAGKRNLSEGARERIAAAQRERWAKFNAEAGKPALKPGARRGAGKVQAKRKMSEAGRERIAAAQRARWAKARKSKAKG